MTVFMKPDSGVPKLPETRTWTGWLPLDKFEATLIFVACYLYFLLASLYMSMWTSSAIWLAFLIASFPGLGTFLIYRFDLLTEDVEQAEEEEQELPQLPVDTIAEPSVINMVIKPASEAHETAEHILLLQSALGTEEKPIVTKEEFLIEACYKISLLPKSQRSEQEAFIAEAHEIIKPARWRS